MKTTEQLRETWRRDQVFDFVQPAPAFDSVVDTTHGPILYVENISVSFDGSRTARTTDTSRAEALDVSSV